MNEVGYETLYSEDESVVGTFNYRLNGFKEPPTKRYLRPFWKEADLTMNNAGYSCSQQYLIDYLKRFFNTFSNANKFGVILFSHISRNYMNRISAADEDVLSFLVTINSTAILWLYCLEITECVFQGFVKLYKENSKNVFHLCRLLCRRGFIINIKTKFKILKKIANG